MNTQRKQLLPGRVAISCVVLGFAAILPANAFSIVNGSFEADDWSDAGAQFDLETTGVTGWTVLDPNGTGFYPIGVAFAPTPYGSQIVVLGGFGADTGTSIQQTVVGLTPGNDYTLSFALSSEGYSSGGFSGNSNVRVSMLNGSSAPSADYAAPLSVGAYWDTWATFSYCFTANSSSATFAFEDLAGTLSGFDIGIDNVSIAGSTCVPEGGNLAVPAALTMLGMALFARRQHCRASLSQAFDHLRSVRGSAIRT